jgi:hypothetical protein
VFGLRLLRARGLLVAMICKLFSFGDVVMRVLFGLTAAPFSVVQLDNGVTL